MSFSGMVKKELSGHEDSARHCCIAEAAAMLSGSGDLERDEEGRMFLVFHSENETVTRKCFTILKKTFNIEEAILVRDVYRQKRGRVYLLRISPEHLAEICQAARLIPDEEERMLSVTDIALITRRQCCKRAFIRGAFLASGSISDPNKGYHFEIVCTEEDRAEQLQKIICSFEIDARIVKRRNSYVVYVKEGAQIVDLLAVMGAGIALMDLENIRILKEMRNTVNRKVNCETANINKTVNAAVKQAEDIRLIERTVGFESLNEGLAEMAALRLQFPEATLKELGMMLSPQVGKSGVNHRLRKLSEIAQELRENEEELL
ncbi:MAG: DNA-binding protein WhiA [Blautia sp.]|nr:DNA-binding protein WhiA [Blautia sp.]